jgi:Porin subfamily
MKMIKSLILGSAAGLLAMGGAQAADLPVKAKAVEYVRICSLYGAGFFYIPGTDTCIKLGGYLRIDTTFNGSIYNQPAWSNDLGQHNRYTDYYGARSRMALTVDTRTATEYGVVRTFAQADFQFTTQQGSNLSTNPATFTGSPSTGTNSGLLNGVGEGYVAVEFVFIQFAGFTFGKSASAYATPWHGYPGNNSSFLLGGHDTVTGVNNIQYTAQFGNGVSGTIGLDDPTVFNRTTIANLTLGLGPTGALANAYGGVHSPDVVGNIRIDQAWGLFQISAAAHEVTASYNVLNTTAVPAGAQGLAGAAPTGFSEINGHPDTKWGGAVMAALQIKNIPTGAGDDIKIDASYAKGDTKNVISTSNASPSFAMFGGTNVAGAYQSVGFGATTDAVFLPAFAGGDGSLHLTTAYGVRGAFNHNWDPYWSSSLFGSYSAVRYDAVAKSYFCAVYTPGKAVSADFVCNTDFNVSQLGVVTRWTPVKNLTFSAEVMWFHLDQNFAGTAALTPAAPKPGAAQGARYEFKDQDAVSLNVRVQRNF